MKMAKETWLEVTFQNVEACLRKNNIKKAHYLVNRETGKTIYQNNIKYGQSTAQTFQLCDVG